MPVAPIKPVFLAYFELSGEKNRRGEERTPSASVARAADRVTDDLSLSAKALKLAGDETQARGETKETEAPIAKPGGRLNLLG